MEETKPNHYKIKITDRKTNESIKCDYFDIGNALDLSLEQFTALRYFRKKGGIEKQINDTEKAIECLKAHIENLKSPNKLF